MACIMLRRRDADRLSSREDHPHVQTYLVMEQFDTPVTHTVADMVELEGLTAIGEWVR